MIGTIPIIADLLVVSGSMNKAGHSFFHHFL